MLSRGGALQLVSWLNRRQSRRSARATIQQPWLWLLVAVVALGGPSACIIHCTIARARQDHQSPVQQHAGMLMPAVAGPCVADGTSTPHSTVQEPSPLTIAIMLPLALVPLVRFAAASLILRPAQLSSMCIPPSRRPPR